MPKGEKHKALELKKLLKNKKKEYDGALLQKKSSQLKGGYLNDDSKKVIEKHELLVSKA